MEIKPWLGLPVDGGDDVVHAKCCEVVVILPPDRPAMVRAILRIVDGVFEGDNNGQQPSDDRQHLVSNNGILAVLVALCEWVDCLERID